MNCPCWSSKPKPNSESYVVSVAVAPVHITSISTPSTPESPSDSRIRMQQAAHTRFRSTEQVSMVTALRTSAPITLSVVDEKKTDDNE